MQNMSRVSDDAVEQSGIDALTEPLKAFLGVGVFIYVLWDSSIAGSVAKKEAIECLLTFRYGSTVVCVCVVNAFFRNMTVEYVQDLSTVSVAGLFKVLFRWEGSIYKLLWKDFLLFLGMFYTVTLVYRLLDPVQQSNFLILSEYCQKFSGIIPVNLVLGFYVSQIIGRFYGQFNSLPWISRLAVFVNMHIRGDDDVSRLLRRTIVRYMCLSSVLCLASICPNVKKRFPTLKHLRDAGLFTENEQDTFEHVDTIYNKWFVPIIWATSLVARARKLGKIKDDIYSVCLVEEISQFQGKLRTLFSYDWVQLPLVYTQVVTLVVYSYFLACLVGKQDIPSRSVGELPFPMLTFLLFFFYMGWLKVAEEMLNPFGDDDDDFDINSVIDFNMEIGYLIVDMHNQGKDLDLSKDPFWDKTEATIPYTAAARKWRKLPHLGTAANMIIPHELQAFIKTLPGLQVLETLSTRHSESTSRAQQQELNRNSNNDYLINLGEQQAEYGDKLFEDDQPKLTLTVSSVMSMDWQQDVEKQDAESEENFSKWLHAHV